MDLVPLGEGGRTGVRRQRLGYAWIMTTSPGDSPLKDPQDWATGDEPATSSQRSYLETLANDTGADVPDELTKAEASQLIDELRDQSPRVSGGDS